VTPRFVSGRGRRRRCSERVGCEELHPGALVGVRCRPWSARHVPLGGTNRRSSTR